MTPESIASQPRHPDRRKPILVLADRYWTREFKRHVGDRFRLDTPSEVKLEDLAELAQRRWRLVLMESVNAAVDQKRPLEALQRWFHHPNTEPVVVLSPFPSSREARDSLNAGAIWYAELPRRPEDMEVALVRSLGIAKKARSMNRVGSLMYQVTHPATPSQP